MTTLIAPKTLSVASRLELMALADPLHGEGHEIDAENIRTALAVIEARTVRWIDTVPMGDGFGGMLEPALAEPTAPR